MIVLDKSYLVGAPTRVVRALCAQRTVVFTETLVFELLTTETDSTALFRKLPARDSPVRLLSNCKALLDCESADHQPCGLLQQHFIKEGFRFNPHLSFPGSPVLDVNAAKIAEWRTAVVRINSGFDVFYGVPPWGTATRMFCPAIRHWVPGHGQELLQRNIRCRGSH